MDYELRETLPTPEEYVALREAAGMSPRSLNAARRGLPNTTYGVTVVPDSDVTGEEEVVGMGRIVGDGGLVFQLVDIAVHPAHQGRGLGTKIVDALMTYLGQHAPPTAYVNLLADVEGFYEHWGFEPTAPASRGMFTRIE
ncbi:GNAT family N-acetyltransferase [Haloarchaeobius sp. TZWSO28]|uniref:GNAT family N-acetyltransferase n=1 Tax=unclassified Haloarchaeobius TaxID=2614452 RepID=UPI003EC08FE6